VTVLEIIRKSADFLTRKGVESPRLQSECILAHVLETPRMQLYLNFERQLSDTQIAACRELVQRRGQREPLQHLLGSVCFQELDIRVNESALIPRPETEQLVEYAGTFLQNLPGPAPTVLDFGTGTGCVAVALAVRFPAARITACDISTEAVLLARSNADLHKVMARIEFRTGDGFEALSPGSQFDLIVSNPPYIPSGEIQNLQPEVRDHDPHIALDGGRDGLDFYRLLAVEAPACLQARGGLIVEFGDGQAGAISEILEREKWIVETPLPDYSGRQRFLLARPST